MIWYRLGRFVCLIFCRLFFRMRVYGRQNIPADGAFIIVSNHQSYLDPVFCGIFSKRCLYYLARDTLFSNRIFGRLLRSVNVIPIRRGQADLPAMKKVIKKLKQGSGVCLFPEATRTRDGKIAPFRPGLGLLCRRGEAPIVPVMIDGAFECWPRNKRIFSMGCKIAVCYGATITTRQIKNMDDRQLAEKLTGKLRQMQNDYRTKQGKKPLKYDNHTEKGPPNNSCNGSRKS